MILFIVKHFHLLLLVALTREGSKEMTIQHQKESRAERLNSLNIQMLMLLLSLRKKEKSPLLHTKGTRRFFLSCWIQLRWQFLNKWALRRRDLPPSVGLLMAVRNCLVHQYHETKRAVPHSL
jgi:hypothetical protein